MRATAAILSLVFFVGSATANPVLRCNGLSGGFRKEVLVVLPTPEQRRQQLWVFKDPSMPKLLHQNVAVGRVLTTETTADGTQRGQTLEHALIVTQFPGDGFSLIAFYLVNNAIWTLKFDPWDNNRKFVLAGDIGQYFGRCD